MLKHRLERLEASNPNTDLVGRRNREAAAELEAKIAKMVAGFANADSRMTDVDFAKMSRASRVAWEMRFSDASFTEAVLTHVPWIREKRLAEIAAKRRKDEGAQA